MKKNKIFLKYEERNCDICKTNEAIEGVYILRGNAGCHYCGNIISLCLKHFKQLKEEIDEEK